MDKTIVYSFILLNVILISWFSSSALNNHPKQALLAQAHQQKTEQTPNPTITTLKTNQTIKQNTSAFKKTLIKEHKLRQNSFNQIKSVPILMYHKIGNCADIFCVTEKNFHQQVKTLHNYGYKTIKLDDLLIKYSLPSKPIILTFDDGYASFYTKAVPILKQYGFSAVNFLVTDYINGYNHLAWEEINKLQAQGFDFQSHTLSHAFLTRINTIKAKNELKKSKQILQNRLNKQINWLAYPYGDYNQKIIKIAKQAGYKGALTAGKEQIAIIDNIYKLARIGVYKNTTIKNLLNKLNEPID